METGLADRENVEETALRRVLAPSAVLCAALMQALDTAIGHVALSSIQGNLRATIDQARCVATGFILANVVAIPLTPRLTRRLGRKRYVTIAIIGVTVAATACGFAPSTTDIVRETA